MPATLSIHDVTVTRGAVPVLDHVDLVAAPGRRTGVVGPNGVGKSTLLAACASALPLDSGEVRVAPITATVGWLRQEPERSTSSLSPGERTRAELALLMAQGANLLVLDEPTNHLDLPAIEQLEQALDAFTGTLLLVTHDRAFLDEVRITRRVRLVEGRIAG